MSQYLFAKHTFVLAVTVDTRLLFRLDQAPVVSEAKRNVIGRLQASSERGIQKRNVLKKHRPRLMAGISSNRCSAGLSSELMNIPGWNRVQYRVEETSMQFPGTHLVKKNRMVGGKRAETRFMAEQKCEKWTRFKGEKWKEE